MGFENNHVKIYHLFDETQKENLEDETEQGSGTSGKPKKRPLRRFDDHLG